MESDKKFSAPVITQRFGTHRFGNPLSFKNWSGIPSLLDAIKYKFFEKDDSAVPDSLVLEQTLPVRKAVFRTDCDLSATWLGHATVFVHLNGSSFITDPVWASNVSPYPKIMSCSRYRPPPADIADLPALNFALISHSHYDHLDINSIKELAKKCPLMKWFVPLGLKALLESGGVNPSNIQEMTWGEMKKVQFGESSLQIWCLPAQHWSQRTAFDRNKSLWSGWAVLGPQHRFYYPGDTGFCDDEFQKIGAELGPFDLAALPIGCFRPKWFMRSQHICPEEAVQIHKFIQSKKSIGIHWGTYKLGSYEHYLEPRSALEEEVKKADLKNEFITLEHGETWSL